MPWNLADRPNLPLGILKSYLAKHGIAVDVYHLHLTVAHRLGRKLYDRIAMNWCLGEALYSTLYAPSEKESILTSVNANDDTTKDLLSDLERITVACLTEINFSKYHIVGFSVAHLQLMASLYTARHFKSVYPDTTIVFGGRGVIGSMGKNLLNTCSEIDLVVNGEGENTLLGLCNLLDISSLSNSERLARIPNLIYRSCDGDLIETAKRTSVDLVDHPAPDYEDFFTEASTLGISTMETVLPIEASRGCSWEHRRNGKQPMACAFCGLNAGWHDYREKPMENVIREIQNGIRQYQVLNVSFVDSCLPESYRDQLLGHLITADEDITLFCELRPDFSEKTARLLARAGTRKVQIGIEGFSTSLLKRIGKGVKAIDNVYRLKLCMTHNIPFQYNLLTHIPGSTKEEIDETMINITRLFSFQPPHAVPFFLSRGSRAKSCPQAFGINPESLDQKTSGYLPSILADKKVTEDVSFECESSESITSGPLKEAWDRVVELVEIWSNIYQTVYHRYGNQHPLSFRRTDEFITVTDLREDDRQFITLDSMDMAIFLTCDSIQNIETLEENFDKTLLSDTLHRLEKFGILLREDDQVLSLPVRAPLPCGVSAKVY